nr:glycosyltransferase [Bacillota bacterium]
MAVEGRSPGVVIICSYPPPYAGMAIYAERLSAYLLERGFDCKVIDVGRDKTRGKAEHVLRPFGGRVLKYFSAMWLLLRCRADVLHINCSSYGNFWASMLVGAFGKIIGRKVLLTVHGGSFPKRVSGFGLIRRVCARIGLSFPDAVICVNDQIEAAVRSLGVPQQRIKLIPAFCLHYLSDTVAREQIPNTVVAFCESHDRVLVSGISLESAYGWRTLIDATDVLRATLPNIGLVIMGSGVDADKCAEMIAARGLSGNVLMAGDLPHPLALTICKEFADIMVRPTLVDGDSSFVREGIALGKPTVASDTDFRPEGVILFKKGDAQDLAEKVEYALEHKEEIEAQLKEIEHPDYFAETLEVYERLLQQKPVRRRGSPVDA